MKRLRRGELLAFVGAICVIVALALPWYENLEGKISAWATFGPAVVLLMLAAVGGIVLAFATLTERNTAFPVAAGVWSTLFGIVASIAAIVRVLERPHHASALCVGAWLGLLGAFAILAGSWQSMRDERIELYELPEIEARPPPR